MKRAQHGGVKYKRMSNASRGSILSKTKMVSLLESFGLELSPHVRHVCALKVVSHKYRISTTCVLYDT